MFIGVIVSNISRVPCYSKLYVNRKFSVIIQRNGRILVFMLLFDDEKSLRKIPEYIKDSNSDTLSVCSIYPQYGIYDVLNINIDWTDCAELPKRHSINVICNLIFLKKEKNFSFIYFPFTTTVGHSSYTMRFSSPLGP